MSITEQRCHRQTPAATTATPPYFTPPAVLSPSAQDNSRFKPSLSHLDLEGCFAVEFFFFFLLRRREVDGWWDEIDGRESWQGVVAVGAVGVNSLERQPGRRVRGERVKEAAKVLGKS